MTAKAAEAAHTGSSQQRRGRGGQWRPGVGAGGGSVAIGIGAGHDAGLRGGHSGITVMVFAADTVSFQVSHMAILMPAAFHSGIDSGCFSHSGLDSGSISRDSGGC